MIPGGSFTKKRIQVWLTRGSGDFGADLGNTKIIDGLRVECHIEKGGHPSKNGCKLKIYGMLQHDMDSLTTTSFKPLAVRKSLVKVLAGDEDPLQIAFAGEITGAWAVYHSPPNLYFHIEALEGFYPAVASAAPKGFSGTVSVSGVMGILATQMGCRFEDAGVMTTLSRPYLSGSLFQQAAQLAEAANIEFGIDNGVLFIAPRGAPRKGEVIVPVVSPLTGMKGYPVFDKKGLRVECLYNSTIRLGGVIKVESEMPNASGLWRVNGLDHHLEAEHPGGAWLSKLKVSRVGN